MLVETFWTPAKVGSEVEVTDKKFPSKEECESWLKENLWRFEEDKSQFDKWYAKGNSVYKYDADESAFRPRCCYD